MLQCSNDNIHVYILNNSKSLSPAALPLATLPLCWKAILSCYTYQEQVTKLYKIRTQSLLFCWQRRCERLISYRGLYKILPSTWNDWTNELTEPIQLDKYYFWKKFILAYWVGYLAFFEWLSSIILITPSGNTDPFNWNMFLLIICSCFYDIFNYIGFSMCYVREYSTSTRS